MVRPSAPWRASPCRHESGDSGVDHVRWSGGRFLLTLARTGRSPGVGRCRLGDLRICELPVEIDEVHWLVSDIEENGPARTPAEVEARPVPGLEVAVESRARDRPTCPHSSALLSESFSSLGLSHEGNDRFDVALAQPFDRGHVSEVPVVSADAGLDGEEEGAV